MVHHFAPEICDHDPLGICLNAVYATLGAPDPAQVDDDMQSKIYAGFPSSTSIRNFLQVVYTGFYPREFREYMYQNESANMKAYGQNTSPIYDLGQFHTPTVLFVGPADQVATVLDVKYWSAKLGTKANVIYVDNHAWAHLDFIFAKNACQKLYTPLIQRLQNCSS
ncbi:unnamed protein product [Allacma fusca]|uniref:Lipase n=1 Tax=Allacma fusca TaxID=39272 RepID=A0A8J2LNB8_9HEXA|nr:unnamed protein product [Allacma fusca]